MKTLVHLLENLKYEVEKGIVFVESGQQDCICSYSELYFEATRVLGDLQAIGIKRNDYVIIQIKKSKDTLLLLWACLLGGIIAVPLPYAHTDDTFLKLKNVSSVLQSSYIIGDAFVQSNMIRKGYFDGSQSYFNFDEIRSSAIGVIERNITESDVALIQFSSGTTGMPKGVIMTNKNILVNLKAISIAAKINEEQMEVGVSWLPLTNDLGLVGMHLSSIYNIITLVMIDSTAFLYDPMILFEKIEKYKGTITVNPNFALDYLSGYFLLKKELYKNYNLSTLRLNLCGSEPVKPETVKTFEKLFSKFSMKSGIILPVYGLAEACLVVAFASLDNPYKCIYIDRNFLSIGDKIRIAEDETDEVTFVSVGQAVTDINISIRDENNMPLDDGHVGVIYLSGDSITSGYINNAQVTKELFSFDGWLNTYDIGVIEQGHLYILGRQKDMIIVCGKNYYCADLEKLISQNIQLESAVVTQFNTETKDDDISVFVLAEIENIDAKLIEEQIKDILLRRIGIRMQKVYFVKSFPRTEGGKVRRFLLKNQIKC